MSALWWYKLVFVTELFISEGFMTFRFERRRLWWLRLLFSVVAAYLVAVFFPLPAKFAYSGWYLSVMCLVLFAVSLGVILFVFRVSFASGLFCAITAYTIQHLSYELYSIFSLLFPLMSRQDMYGNGVVDLSTFNTGVLVALLIYFDLFVLICGGSYFILRKYMRQDTRLRINGMLLLYSAGILLIDVVLNAFVVYIPDTVKSYELIICVFNVLCCLLVFYIQVNVVRRRDIEKEMEGMAATISQMHQQYMLRKESIDLINRKCHDLRYQMARFAAGDAVDREEFHKIEEAIAIYDNTVKTGNDVLDVILTEKSLLCREKGIELTCMADCSRFTFMHEGELYAIFGNLVDNAIEAAEGVEDLEKRCIGINIYTVGEIVSIVIENYFSGELKFSGALPMTTKGDENYHGFGLRSVEMIVKNYAGDLTVQAEGGIFRVTVLLPIPNKK